MPEQRVAKPIHHTATTEEPGDGDEFVADAPNDAAVLRHMHAWWDADGDPEAKATYKFPHHAPGTDTAANLPLVRNGLARLSQADIPEGDRAGVEAHLRAHLEDGGGGDGDPARNVIPPLSSRDRRRLPQQVLDRITTRFGDGILESRHSGFDIDYQDRTLEHRATQRVELRQSDDGDPIVHGFATVYEARYPMFGGPPFGFTETVGRGATAKSVAELDDVFMFFNHEGLPLARRSAGTLEVRSEHFGLFTEARFDRRSPFSMEIASRMQRCNEGRCELDAMSFAFEVTRQEWSEDFTERRILEVRLFDVSVVNFPANPATSVGLRDQHPEPVTRGDGLALARAQRERLLLSNTAIRRT